MKKKILIIEDEADLVRGLALNLRDEGYEVDSAHDGNEGLRKVRSWAPDLVVLDIMLPGKDGLEVCRELRQARIATPIIMLTARGTEVDKVVGLELGADDYMTKPFSVRELMARIKAHLRRETRHGSPVPDVVSLDDLEIDFPRFAIRRRGREQAMTSLEAKILKCLIAHSGEVVTRDRLFDEIWGYDETPTTRTIDSHVLKLRKKIEPDPSHPALILSVYGEGYRFVDR